MESAFALSSSSLPRHQVVCQFNYCKNIPLHFCVNSQLIHHSTTSKINSTAPAAANQVPAVKRKWAKGIDLDALCKEGRLTEALGILHFMDRRGIPVDFDTYDSLLQACTNMKALTEGKRVHAHMLANGFDQNLCLGTKLVTMYAICGSMADARLVFDKLLERNVFLWNAMIRGYAWNGPFEEAFILYHHMQRAGIRPDNFTFPFVLKACSGLAALQLGKEIHCHIVKFGFESDVFVGNALIDIYAKCSSIEIARQLFDKMSTRDVVSWNAMMSGYVHGGYGNEALALFHQMQLEDVKPNWISIVSVLSACADLAALQQGKDIHDYIIDNGFESHVSIGIALVDMYAKCGKIESARQVFDKMSKGGAVLWNTMIAGYARNGYAQEALKFFRQMQQEGVKPNRVTVVSVLPACTDLKALPQGRELHNYIIKNGFESHVFVRGALIDMYAECRSIEVARLIFDQMSENDSVSWNAMIAGYAKFGDIEAARHLFDKMPIRNVVSWNAMIAGYVQNGHANDALTMFHQMQLGDVKPDLVSMVSVLPACADLTDLDRGRELHNYIIKNAFESHLFVRSALIDMYASCGNLGTARLMFDKISERDSVSWNAMIAGYSKSGNMEIARQLFDNMPDRNVVSWNTMIAGYSQNGYANDALAIFHQMQMAGVKPDLITVIRVLTACAHLAALQQGKWIHDYIIKSGFVIDVFVGTALITMYAKCGSIEIARRLFDKMSERHVVTWNAMISGYGMHGCGEDALAIFYQMQEASMKPDPITFVGVLSACSHSGLLVEGWEIFQRMSTDYCITPTVEHYACMVDLLGRSGHLDEAQDFIKKMPVEPDACVWGALLSACRIHHNIELAECVSERLFQLEPKNTGNYMLLADIYAAAGRWDDVAKVRKMVKDKQLKKGSGCSWIEIRNRVHAFLAGDRSHPQSEKIYAMLESLAGKMEAAGYVPDTTFVLHNVEEEGEKEHALYSCSEKLATAFGLIDTNPGTHVQITKSLRICDDCHDATQLISTIVR